MTPPDPPLTGAQRAYLAAFDAHLAARSREDRDATRARMSEQFIGVLEEGGVDRAAVPHRQGAGRMRRPRARRMRGWARPAA
jgi:hypothetical protein